MADPTFAKVAETSMRMFAGVVPPKTLREVHSLAEPKEGEAYPWQRVCDRIVQDPIPGEELVQRSLVAQRNWLAVGAGARKPSVGRSLERAGKGLMARLVGRGIAFLVWVLLVVLVLLVVRIRWEGADVYRLLDLVPAGVVEKIRGLLGG